MGLTEKPLAGQVCGHGQKVAGRMSRDGVSSAFARSYGATGVMNRGDRREAIFREDRDRVLFLGWKVVGRGMRRGKSGAATETEDHDDLELDCKTVKDGWSGFLGKPAPKRERIMKICAYAGLTPSCLQRFNISQLQTSRFERYAKPSSGWTSRGRVALH
jgi:hypothetical protein